MLFGVNLFGDVFLVTFIFGRENDLVTLLVGVTWILVTSTYWYAHFIMFIYLLMIYFVISCKQTQTYKQQITVKQ